MFSDNDVEIAEMLATRLCHDLTGPIGAVNNGAEFLEDDEFGMADDAMGLIISSAKEAVARLQFYRHAYGKQSQAGEASLSEKKQLVADFLSSGKVKLDWPDTMTDACPIFVSNVFAQLLLNMIIIVNATLLKGGVLSVSIDEDLSSKEVTLSVTATGDMIKNDKEINAILEGYSSIALSPQTVQVYLTTKIAKLIDANFKIVSEEHSYSISAVKKSI